MEFKCLFLFVKIFDFKTIVKIALDHGRANTQAPSFEKGKGPVMHCLEVSGPPANVARPLPSPCPRGMGMGIFQMHEERAGVGWAFFKCIKSGRAGRPTIKLRAPA